MTLDVAAISIMVALSLGLFGGMLTVLTQLRAVTHEMGILRGDMSDLRGEVREELRRFGERLTRHEQSGQ